MNNPLLHFQVDSLFQEEIKKLPWHLPLEEWRKTDVRFLNIKQGISRHLVIFVKSGRFSFGIKEISKEIAQKEISNYEKLLLLGIHTLIPVGYVVRTENPIAVETPVGIHYEKNTVAHTITLLVEKVIPDSQLYPIKFSQENREKILDCIAELFVELHGNGVYWGDASLANTLIKIEKKEIPFIGTKRILQAYLADAETVEIHKEISSQMREADIQFFFESMEWLYEDIRQSGREYKIPLEEEKQYLKNKYENLYAVKQRKKDFEKETNFDIEKCLGGLTNPMYVDLLFKHINEHKWYLSEKAKEEISLTEAVDDWYKKIFLPLCVLFRTEGIVEHTQGKTAAELYIEIMTHKYYMSEKAQHDVGMIAATKDYIHHLGIQTFPKKLRVITQKMKSLFKKEHYNVH